jgi:hypothetical protein
MEQEGLLPFSQEPTSLPYPDSFQVNSTTRSYITFFFPWLHIPA